MRAPSLGGYVLIVFLFFLILFWHFRIASRIMGVGSKCFKPFKPLEVGLDPRLPVESAELKILRQVFALTPKPSFPMDRTVQPRNTVATLPSSATAAGFASRA